MQITVATFNLENLFTRPTAMSGADDDTGRQAIEDHAAANAIADKMIYSQADKDALVALSQRYGWHLRSPPSNSLLFLQKIRGRLFSNTQSQVCMWWRAAAPTGQAGSNCAAPMCAGKRPSIRPASSTRTSRTFLRHHRGREPPDAEPFQRTGPGRQVWLVLPTFHGRRR